jgi:MinD-like ATPase involved in chromosome partitioning or flagellar assembly
MRIAVAVPAGHRQRLSSEAIRHGHEVVLTSTGAEDLVDACETTRPELVIVWSTAFALTSALLSHCDVRGIRLLAVISNDADRRHAAEVGVYETVALEASWKDYEAGLVFRLRSNDDPISPPPVAAAPELPESRSATRDAQRSARSEAPSAATGAATGGEDGWPAVPVAQPAPRRVRGTATETGDDFAALAPRPTGSVGAVIAVWGAAGAPGRTMLSISVAAELASRGYSVALCDADTYSASIAPTLGILDEAPGFAAACRLAGNESLNRVELERIGSRYGTATTGFWVLTGISTPSRWPELSAQRVEEALAECRRWAEFTVVDTGFSLEGDEEISSDLLAPRRNAATIAALGVADQVLAVGSADPVGLSRFLRGYSDLIELVGADVVTVVINKVRASAIGLNPVGQVQQTLKRFGGINDAVLIPADHAAMDSAILVGKTLREVAPKSAVQVAIALLASTRILPGVRVRRDASDGLA